MDRSVPPAPNEGTPKDATNPATDAVRDDDDDAIAPNPPRTKTGPFAAPKFGSAGSGGAELEPGPERD